MYHILPYTITYHPPSLHNYITLITSHTHHHLTYPPSPHIPTITSHTHHHPTYPPSPHIPTPHTSPTITSHTHPIHSTTNTSIVLLETLSHFGTGLRYSSVRNFILDHSLRSSHRPCHSSKATLTTNKKSIRI